MGELSKEKKFSRKHFLKLLGLIGLGGFVSALLSKNASGIIFGSAPHNPAASETLYPAGASKQFLSVDRGKSRHSVIQPMVVREDGGIYLVGTKEAMVGLFALVIIMMLMLAGVVFFIVKKRKRGETDGNVVLVSMLMLIVSTL